MSRHRFVKNMDLDAEMADDNPEDESGMTAEQKAQMITSMPIAKAMLKDVKPPIPDDAIADSLWHYWFDVEKAVQWLKKDWERKGLPTPPHLRPSPDEAPRPRAAKRARLSKESSPQPPLTALQRLSISRKDPATPGKASSSSALPQPAASTPPHENGKPMSKLALLAQKRKEAAAQAAAGASSATATPTSTPSRTLTPSTPDDIPSSASKPLSKLAQKMAAAKLAREQSSTSTSTPQPPSSRLQPIPTPAGNAVEDEEMEEIVYTPPNALFPSTSPTKPTRTSPFFNIITSTAATRLSDEKPPGSASSMHLPVVRDLEQMEKRIRNAFAAAESPDDVVLRARQGRAGTGALALTRTSPNILAAFFSFSHPFTAVVSWLTTSSPKLTPPLAAKVNPPTKSVSQPGKPRTQAAAVAGSSIGIGKTVSQPGTPRKPKVAASTNGSAGSSKASTPKASAGVNQTQQDLAGLHMDDEADEAEREREKEKFKERAVLSMKYEELVAKVKKDEAESGRKSLSLIVVGHVDAGKSTLMGRLLYELGELSEKEKTANERGSKKVGKGSFAFAWGLDALGDERDRGVTIDIATTHFQTPHRAITLLDAPGHKDFIPAMISGAAQADVALMVVDGSPGEFEAGFDRGGQTREHAWLVRSLGVKEIIVGVNKLDMVSWSQDRYDEITAAMKPFLVSAGFSSSKTTFLPIAAMEGVNILERDEPLLNAWYSGPTLIDTLDKVEVPERPYETPLRIPVSNVFKGQTAVASGVAVSGRLCSGVVQVGDRIRAVPGDEVANVRTIEVDEDSAPYAVAGQNVTLYLSGIDPIHLSIGTVLCPTSLPVKLVSQFTAQILVFDLQTPIIAGAAVELFHHSMNLPANITKLISISEKGQVIKKNPRVLQKGTTALVEITLRSSPNSSRPATIPLETAADNKEMGRVLIRRSGETIAAGVVMELV